jgi:hypothetical protein
MGEEGAEKTDKQNEKPKKPVLLTGTGFLERAS